MGVDDRMREFPGDRFDAASLRFDLHAEAGAIRREKSPGHQGHRQKALFKHGGRTIALFVMDAGSSLGEHATAGTVSIQSIEGEIEVTIGEGGRGGTERLGAGSMVILSPGTKHGVRASGGDAVFLLQVSLGD